MKQSQVCLKTLLLAVMMLGVAAHAVTAAVVFYDDFEGGDVSRWDGEINDQMNTGTVSINASLAKQGSYSLKCEDTSTYFMNGRIGLHKAVYQEGPLYFRFYVYDPTAHGECRLACINDAIGYVRLAVNSASGLGLAKEPLVYGNFKNSNVTVAENRWYCVEIGLPACGTSDATIEWWIDGVQQSSVTHDLTESKAWTNIAIGKIEGTGGGTGFGTAYIDEVVVSEEYIGPVQESTSGVLEFAADGYAMNENTSGPLVITVRRRYGSQGTVSVTYGTSDRAAEAGSDYTAASGTLTWNDGDTQDKSFTVDIINDIEPEIRETAELTLSDPTGGAVLGACRSVLLTIKDNDGGSQEFYVSKLGSNGDGRSWTTAWNELDRINWDDIQPGDTVYIDGGAEEMTYEETLHIIKSGEAGAPITIQVSDESGRDGNVVMFGGRETPLPDGGLAYEEYVWDGVSGLQNAMSFHNTKWIVVDGAKWRGFTVYGGDGFGFSCSLLGGNKNITVRNMEVYDCGRPEYYSSSGWRPGNTGQISFGPGISRDITLERMIVHDGCDAFQGNYIDNFVIRQSWVYIGRAHKDNPDRPFSWDGHPDAFMMAAGNNWLFEDCVIHGYMQGIYLNNVSGPESITGVAHPQVDDVVVRNCLTYQCTQNIQAKASIPPASRWIIENVTSYNNSSETYGTTVRLDAGYDHLIRNTITSGWVAFRDGQGLAPDWVVTDNTRWDHFYEWAPAVNPMFKAVPATWSDMNADFEATNPAVAGKGSRVTSVAVLFEMFPDGSGYTPYDATPPSDVPAVRDGTGADTDSVSSTTELSANWDASIDFESEIERYWYAIGTTAGGTDVVDWTDNSTATSVTRTGLTLTQGSIYYFTVKAENGAGLESNPVSSDGQLVPANGLNPGTGDSNLTVRHINPCPITSNSSLSFYVSGTSGDSELRIYSIAGKLVKVMSVTSGTGEVSWDLLNNRGNTIRPGVYLYVMVDSNNSRSVGKLVVTR